MNTDLLVISTILVLGFGIVIYLISRNKKPKEDSSLLEWLKSTQQQISETNKTINEALRKNNEQITTTLFSNTQSLNQRLDKAAEVISGVQKNIGEMSEIGRSMRELQDFMKSPKLRGNIGEQILKELLGQMLPKQSFHMQYAFKGGSIVDAAITTEAGIIPIDSKFPMENFRKMNTVEDATEKKLIEKIFVSDVKKHIDDISKKYILPEEGTMDFALMYIPSEPVYYEVADNVELLDFARRKRVYAVSPTTLYAHLQLILLSFEGKKIETKSREVFALLRALKVDYENTYEKLGILGKHIGNASSQFSNLMVSFQRIGLKLNSTRELDKIQTEEIEN